MSRKNLSLIQFVPLSLIQFVPSEGPTGIDVAQLIHKRIETLGVASALSKMREPFAECGVECPALAAGDGTRALDQVLIGA
ncbi:MAG: hypothetical protein ABSG51_10765 [Terracidiphilus sp.]